MNSQSKQRVPAKVLDRLREARRHATLEDAKFDWDDSTMTAKCRDGDFEGRPDTFIKERVRCHHASWIIGPLDAVIAWAEGKKSTA